MPGDPDEDIKSSPGRESAWARRKRRLLYGAVNLWLAFHLTAIFLPGAAMPPSPQFAREAYARVSGYLQLLFMDHGYHFFGPDPGSSTLLGFVTEADNGEQHRGHIPHKAIQPRLLYHRHFMLTEAMPHLEGDPRLYAMMKESYAGRLRAAHQADRVELTRVTHFLIGSDRFLAGGKLSDPDLYEEERLGEYRWTDSSVAVDSR